SATGAAQPRPNAAASPESVTVFLKAPHPAALRRLAFSTGLTRQQRLHALKPLVPSSATHTAVARVLHRDGFTVGHQSTWSVTAVAPKTVVARVFGTRPSLSHASLAAAAGPLSRVPASLRPVVSAV